MAKIKASGFDFKNIDFVADRFIIDIIDGEIQEKYLSFPQENVTNHTTSASKPDKTDKDRGPFNVSASGF
jgi:hypothetical protein